MHNRDASDPGGYDRTAAYGDDAPPAPDRSSSRRVLLGILALLLAGVALLVLYAYRLWRASSAGLLPLPVPEALAPAGSALATGNSTSAGAAHGASSATGPNVVAVAGTPINEADPTSGNPIVPGITSTHKGHTLGHCCAESRDTWHALSESQKDDIVSRLLSRRP